MTLTSTPVPPEYVGQMLHDLAIKIYRKEIDHDPLHTRESYLTMFKELIELATPQELLRARRGMSLSNAVTRTLTQLGETAEDPEARTLWGNLHATVNAKIASVTPQRQR